MPRSSGESRDAHSATQPEDWAEVEAGLAKVQQQFEVLKDRYSQVRRDLRMQEELREEAAQLGRWASPSAEGSSGANAGGGTEAAAIQAELKDIQQQLEQIEVAIESQLFSWDSFREVFWQMIRFVGLGIVIGWVLKSLAG
ncbi:MAG: hypothetical protein HC857_04575 [Synechococcales cyanobacterium RU_4_20]|nr:hypothetical protein [Synechococcales cyanobacterium RU_4_20]NJR67723.1 hypothetical protein [Synechococcales cyanobacterium CRU_2_2]